MGAFFVLYLGLLFNFKESVDIGKNKLFALSCILCSKQIYFENQLSRYIVNLIAPYCVGYAYFCLNQP